MYTRIRVYSIRKKIDNRETERQTDKNVNKQRKEKTKNHEDRQIGRKTRRKKGKKTSEKFKEFREFKEHYYLGKEFETSTIILIIFPKESFNCFKITNTWQSSKRVFFKEGSMVAVMSKQD